MNATHCGSGSLPAKASILHVLLHSMEWKGGFLLKLSDLDKLKNTDIKTIDPSGLVDVQSVTIDVEQPIAERMQRYLDQIKNPYCFLCKGVPVRVSFVEGEKPLDETLIRYFIRLREK